MREIKRPTLDLRPPRIRDTVVPGPEPVLRPDQRATLKHICLERPTATEVLPRFGEWLVQRCVLTRAQLLRALATSTLHDWRIGDAVVLLRLASREQVESEAESFERHRGLEEQSRRLELERQLCQLEHKRRTADPDR
jgi:hypothetical protein